MKTDEINQNPHEFCDKEIAALEAIALELKQGINKALEHQVDSKIRLILLKRLHRADVLMETYWMDGKPKEKKAKKQSFATRAWLGARRRIKRI